MPASANTRLLSALRRVIVDARTMSKGTPVSPSNHVEVRSLPEPIPITPQLLELGLSQAAADALSQAYIRSGLQLKRKTEAFIYSSVNAGGVKESSQIDTVYLKMYLQTLKEWTAKIVDAALARSKTNTAHIVPVLENVEHRNNVVTPSSPVELKQMSKRSISKSGRDQTDFPHIHKAPHNKLPADTNYTLTSLVLPPAPSYAFPSVYPPTCEWKPLTFHRQSAIPCPEWRLPSPSSRLSNTEVDMDSLTKAFMRLRIHIVDDVTTKRSLLDLTNTRPISSKSTDFADSKLLSPPPTILSCKSSRTVTTPRQQKNNVASPRQKPLEHLTPYQRDVSAKHRYTPISSHLNSRCMSLLSPTPADPVTPVAFTFSSKISGFSPRPALPRLDTTSPTAISNTFTESQSNLAYNFKPVISHPPGRIDGLKKAAPLPRRRPRPLDTSRTPSGISALTLSRTPSLASISSDDSDSSSSHSIPVTPPAPHCDLPVMLPELSLLPNGSCLPHTPCAIEGLDKSLGIHEDIFTGRAELNLLRYNMDR